MSRTAFRLLMTVALLLAPSVAFAHPGHGEGGSLLAGFIHPFSGIDHLLAMTAVGLFAAHLGGRALWAVPATFVAMMALGGVFGAAGVSLPFAETAIALSVLVFGFVIFSGMTPPVLTAMALVGTFAAFHGHAHGAEIRSVPPGPSMASALWSQPRCCTASALRSALRSAGSTKRQGASPCRLAASRSRSSGRGLPSVWCDQSLFRFDSRPLTSRIER